MTHDRRRAGLHRLAALAAGYELEWAPEWPGGGCLMRRVIPEPEEPFSKRVPWNPLEDDGDAFRLAVKLGIEWKRPQKSRSIGHVVKVWFNREGNQQRAANMFRSELVNGSVAAATRRAIFMAAVEIGRSIEQHKQG